MAYKEHKSEQNSPSDRAEAPFFIGGGPSDGTQNAGGGGDADGGRAARHHPGGYSMQDRGGSSSAGPRDPVQAVRDKAGATMILVLSCKTGKATPARPVDPAEGEEAVAATMRYIMCFSHPSDAGFDPTPTFAAGVRVTVGAAAMPNEAVVPAAWVTWTEKWTTTVPATGKPISIPLAMAPAIWRRKCSRWGRGRQRAGRCRPSGGVFRATPGRPQQQVPEIPHT